jgi:hypothetical protein
VPAPKTKQVQAMAIPGYISERQQAQRLDVAIRTLRSWRQQGVGPAWTKVGKKVRYPEGADERWLESNLTRPVREQRQRRAS